MEKIQHPVSGNITQGARLPLGTELEEGDVYPSTTGQWGKCPCPGTLNRNSDETWVRPIKVE